MTLVTVGILVSDLIALPAVSSGATLTLTIRKASGGTLAGGTFTFLAGFSWRLTFTPTTVNEVYSVEVTDTSNELVYQGSYQAVGQTISAPTSTSLGAKLDIINIALGKLTLKSIASLADTSVPGLAMVNSWSSCLKECLGGHDWPFATVIQALTKDSTVSISGYDYAYTYPALCVKAWSVFNEATLNREIGEEFETLLVPGATNKQIIATNFSDAYIRYTYFLDDSALFDTFFSGVLATRLAVECAMKLTGDQALATRLIGVFNTLMSEAERMTSYEKNKLHDKSQDSSILNARG